MMELDVKRGGRANNEVSDVQPTEQKALSHYRQVSDGPPTEEEMEAMLNMAKTEGEREALKALFPKLAALHKSAS